MTVRLLGPDAGLPACDVDALVARADEILAALGQDGAELSLALVGDAAMAELNERFRGREGPTDVLSFSLLEGEHAEHRDRMLGDVVIDLDAAARQAPEQGHDLDAELCRLLIHGTLHLLGHDHEADEAARVMAAEERRVWNSVAGG